MTDGLRWQDLLDRVASEHVATPEAVSRASAALAARPADSITLDTVAAELGVSPHLLAPLCGTAATLIRGVPEPSAPSAAPLRLGPYVLLDELGRGGMGVVYRARHDTLGTLCAVKVLAATPHVSPSLLARFRLEASAVARMGKHPNVVSVHHADEQAGVAFYAMDLVDGPSLRARLRKGPLPPAEAARIVEEAAQGLHFAHARGLVHRDVKPENLLLGPDGTVQVADFGLARDISATTHLTASGEVLGTPHYMAPEQVRGQASSIDARTDVYALGAVLYELLTGQPAHPGEQIAEVFRHIEAGEVVPPRRHRADLQPGLVTVALKCLSSSAAERYATAEALAEDLARWRRGEAVLARPEPVLARVWRKARRKPLAVALLLAAVIVAGIAAHSASQGREIARRKAEYLEELSRSGRTTLEAALAKRALGHLRGCRRLTEGLLTLVGKLIDLDPSLAEPWYFRGRIERALGHDAAAEASQGEAVRCAEATDATEGSRAIRPYARYERGVLRGARYGAERVQATIEIFKLRWRGGGDPPALATTAEVDTLRPDLAVLRREAIDDLAAVADDRSDDPGLAALRPAARGIEAGLGVGDAVEGARLLEQALHEDPRLEECWPFLSEYDLGALDWKGAADRLRKGHEADRGSLHLLLEFARLEEQAACVEEAAGRDGLERFERARAALEERIAIDDACALALGRLSEVLLWEAVRARGKGDDPASLLAASVNAADRAVRIDPAFGAAWYARARAQQVEAGDAAERGRDPRGAWTGALAAYDQAKAIFSGPPKDPAALADVETYRAQLHEDRAVWLDERGEDAQDEYAAGIADCEAALSADLRDDEAMWGLASLRTSLGEWRRRHGQDSAKDLTLAAEAVGRAVALSPDSPEALAQAAGVHLAIGTSNYARAVDPGPEFSCGVDLAERALAACPTCVSALNALVRIHSAWGTWKLDTRGDPREEWSKALAACERAIALCPTDTTDLTNEAYVHADLARWAIGSGDDPRPEWEKAAEACRRVLELNPRSGRALHALAVVHWDQSRWMRARGEDALAELAEARSGFEKEIAEAPGDPETGSRLGDVLRVIADLTRLRGGAGAAGYEEAITVYAGAIAQNSGDWRSRLGRGLALEALGRHREAVAELEAAREAGGERVLQAGAWLARAKAEAKAGAGPAPPWVADASEGHELLLTGMYAEGRSLLERAIAGAGEEVPAPLRAEVALDCYEVACACAQASAGRSGAASPAREVAPADVAKLRDEAFRHLADAVRFGWRHVELTAGDDDLAPLRADPRWAELLRRMAK